jgi:hypothetical protein
MRHELLTISAAIAVTAFGAGRTATPVSPSLSAISFMTGCWTGPSPNGATIEEHYSAATENMMIGMTRYVRNGRVVDFEFTTVERTESTFVMTPRPKGVKSDAFPLKDVADGRATWENLGHDFPQRIIYRRGADGSLVARIEGTTSAGERHVEWTMHPCGNR